MTYASSSVAESKAVQSSRWFLAFGASTIPLDCYLFLKIYPWVFAPGTPASTTVTYLGVCALLAAIGAILFGASHLLKHRLLLSVGVASPILLSGPNHLVGVPLSGAVRKFRSNPELVGSAGSAYIARIDKSWYFVAEEAADALRAYNQPPA